MQKGGCLKCLNHLHPPLLYETLWKMGYSPNLNRVFSPDSWTINSRDIWFLTPQPTTPGQATLSFATAVGVWLRSSWPSEWFFCDLSEMWSLYLFVSFFVSRSTLSHTCLYIYTFTHRSPIATTSICGEFFGLFRVFWHLSRITTTLIKFTKVNFFTGLTVCGFDPCKLLKLTPPWKIGQNPKGKDHLNQPSHVSGAKMLVSVEGSSLEGTLW